MYSVDIFESTGDFIMTNPIQGNNNLPNLYTPASKASSSVTNPEITGMEKAPKTGLVKLLQTIANAFRSIGESVTQANSGKAISMSISVKNLGIASNPARSEPLNETGVKNLKDHVTSMTPEKRQPLVDSAVKDVANGGHNLLKLLNRNPDIFKIVVESGGNRLIEAMDTHSDKIPHKLLSAVSDHMPKYIRDQCVTEGDYGALTADFDKGATKIAGFFEMGVMSLHEALESIKTLISSDIDGAMVKTGKDDIGEIFGGIREIVGTHGGAELRDGLAIRKQFEAMSRPGEIAGGVLDGLNSGGSLEDKDFRDSVNQALTAVGISLKFTEDRALDGGIKLALKNISKQTGAGSGGDAMIFNRLNMPELKELKAMALLPDGQTQIEARLNSYSGSTPEAATAIATACIKTFPIKPDQWVAVEELHELLKRDFPQALASEKDIQQRVKSMFPGGGGGLVKALEANPALFGTLKDPMSKPVERCIRGVVSDPNNRIPPEKAMSIFKALNEGNISNGKPPTLSEIATDYALKTSVSGDSIDFKKLSNTTDSLVRLGLDMDAVGEIIIQSVRMGTDNLQPLTEDPAGYILAAKAILIEHSSPETKRLMAISDSFKELATKAGDEREFLEGVIDARILDPATDATAPEFLDKAQKLNDVARQKGIEMPKTVTEAESRRSELKTSVVTTLEISKALKSITVSSLSTIDGLISSPEELMAQLRQQLDLNSYDKVTVTDIALKHLTKACIETTPNPIGILKAETIVHMDTEKPNVDKAAVNKLVKQLDSRLNIFGGIVNAWQKNFSPAEYNARKLDKLENLVTNIQKEVNADRLTWNKETQTLAIEMVSQKLEQYIGQLDRMSGPNSELKTELMKQASVLLDKIDKVIVPAAQFERLTPKGDISRIAAPTIHNRDATAPNSLEIGNKNYAIGKLIGHGGSGNVYRCDGKENGEKGVVKVMLLTDSIGTLEALAEVYTSQQFAGHSHIMSPSSVAITELDENDMRYLALVMPEADQGDMENVVKKLADKPPAEQTPVFLKLLTDAADGLVEMHRKGFAHRDIKPGNIFIKTGLDSEPIGMLGDLGLAQDISKFDSLKMGGTEPYMPTDQTVSLSVDSYAFGMMAFQLLSGGSFPFLANKEDEYDGILTPPAMPDTAVLRERIDARIPNASYAVKSLIENSLSAVPENRPTMLAWRDALSGPSAKGREEIAEMTAHIQRGNAADMKTETDVVKLGADFFRAMPKMEVTLPGGLRIAGTDAGGAKAFLTKLFNQDSNISESTQAALADMPLNDMNDMARIIRLIPKDAMTYSLIKMTNQSMLAELNGHMAQDFQGDVSAYSFESGPARRINLDISDVNKPKVTVNQTYDYKTNPASETPDFSVSTSLSVQHDLGTGQVGSSVEFKSIHTPTANASLKAVQDHFKALGAIEKLAEGPV